MADHLAASYDEMPYMNRAFPQTHPDRLATLATLFGLTPADLGTCRVLELGCASGDNLIPMATALPNAHFVGVDFSARQIEQGVAIGQALQLRNIELRFADIGDIDESWGKFHYIICHGIYSWVPQRIRERILAICRGNLAREGVAYVSYNTLPGWHMRGMVREMMLFHSAGAETPAVKVQQARALLHFLAQNATPNTAYSMSLRQELDSIVREPDAYVFHDHLEDVNEPFYFHQFADAAARHGLQYLAEANLSQMLITQFPAHVGDTLRRIAPDIVRMEQYIDFLRNRSFRQSLLVHQGVTVNRQLNGERVTTLYVASAGQFVSSSPSLAEGVTESFRAPNGAAIATSNAVTKAALTLLAQRWPLGFRFQELLESARSKLAAQDGSAILDDALLAKHARTLASDMLHSYAADVVELRMRQPRMTLAPSARPIASPLARLQAERCLPITNLRHEPVVLDTFASRLLRLLDGTRDRQALIAAMSADAREGLFGSAPQGATSSEDESVEKTVHDTMDSNLQKLARSALLLG